jgi:diguanylate cyclase (GGDEF)-like protein
VLRQLAERLGRGQRSVDVIARYGGEEFAAILPETGMTGGRVFAERVRAAIGEVPMALPGGVAAQVTVSIGVAAWPHPDVTSIEELLGRADAALYRAKAAGKNRVVVDRAD